MAVDSRSCQTGSGNESTSAACCSVVGSDVFVVRETTSPKTACWLKNQICERTPVGKVLICNGEWVMTLHRKLLEEPCYGFSTSSKTLLYSKKRFPTPIFCIPHYAYSRRGSYSSKPLLPSAKRFSLLIKNHCLLAGNHADTVRCLGTALANATAAFLADKSIYIGKFVVQLII